ncbi:ABC transporter substrate-binding protein [Microvirga sp. BT689]|uniref:ABC transporter substrate-binding protein n=1 Tax=Microvirga arvi TaxID=2778731 RepID=UPI00195100F1|nr:ABC transporter substrate-binding protein [Microvirga arvi]MBM6584443.1 ABC transporter substrate-binding protein [Microvirga arvi]
MRRCRLGFRIRSACILAISSLVLGLMSVAQAAAEQPRRIGRLLMADPCPPNNLFEAEDALTTALAERGWKQGQNFVWDCVSAGGRLWDLDKLAAELVARQPELLETQSSPAIHALKATKTTIPIVMSTPDPVGDGFVQSLARPGGNITGVADLGLDLAVKRIELARELIPALTKVAVLERVGGDATYYKRLEDQLNRAVDRFGIEWRVYPHQSRPEDLEQHFRAMQQDGYRLLYLIATPFTFGNRKLISDLALKYGIHMLSEHPQFAQDGALLSYGVDNDEVQRHMAPQIDAVLRGARPETLPIDQMTKLQLVINLKTARALGVEIPPDLLVRADEVIE